MATEQAVPAPAPGRVIVSDKWSGERLGELPLADVATIERALALATVTARVPWPARERAAALRRAAALLSERRAQFATTMQRETGFTDADVANELDRATVTLEVCADEATRLVGEPVPLGASPGFDGRIAFTIRAPVGVVLAITPFNAPLNTPCHKVGPALAAGNAVLLKPAELTPLTAEALVTLLHDAGVPSERLQILHGGPDVAGPLLRDERVAFTTFTGSTRVGEIVKRETGARPVSLELGSVAATFVCAGADVDRAVAAVARAGYRKAGQVCTSVQLVYVHDSLHDAFAAALATRVGALVAGDPADPRTDLGPLISTAAAERVEALVRRTVDAGARLATGGGREGALVQPTVLEGVEDGMPLTREEAFGPVVGITRFADLDEAIERANRNRYGLQAGVFTDSLSEALELAQRLEVGGVIVNSTSSTRADEMPFGGQKASGFGKEGPHHAMREMTVERLVMLGP